MKTALIEAAKKTLAANYYNKHYIPEKVIAAFQVVEITDYAIVIHDGGIFNHCWGVKLTPTSFKIIDINCFPL